MGKQILSHGYCCLGTQLCFLTFYYARPVSQAVYVYAVNAVIRIDVIFCGDMLTQGSRGIHQLGTRLQLDKVDYDSHRTCISIGRQ